MIEWDVPCDAVPVKDPDEDVDCDGVSDVEGVCFCVRHQHNKAMATKSERAGRRQRRSSMGGASSEYRTSSLTAGMV